MSDMSDGRLPPHKVADRTRGFFCPDMRYAKTLATAVMLEETVEGGHRRELRTVRPGMVQGRSTCERR